MSIPRVFPLPQKDFFAPDVNEDEEEEEEDVTDDVRRQKGRRDARG